LGSGGGHAPLARSHARRAGLAGVGVSQRKNRKDRTISCSRPRTSFQSFLVNNLISGSNTPRPVALANSVANS